VPAPAGKSESEKGGRGDDLKSNIQVKKLARHQPEIRIRSGAGGKKSKVFGGERGATLNI
jgi:hypothetical protein